MACLSLKSPAKLNLMLHITGRREDGYHELQTVFQFVSLYDVLDFETTRDTAIRRISGNDSVDEEQDLIVRSARLLQQRFGVDAGVEISVSKRIPMGGGLGGGSSDAASVLMALNRLWNLNLPNIELRRIGLELGADIPIFIFGHSAWAEGVGEHLEAVNLPQSWYLIIHPGVFVSTAQIFGSRDLTRDCHPITIRAFLDGAGGNVCEAVARRLHPEIHQALEWLDGFSPARMTGTGACIFAAFDSERQARAVCQQLPGQWTGFVAQGMNRNPVHEICFDRST